MRKRTRAREYALQILYQMEIRQDAPEQSLQGFWMHQREDELSGELKVFCEELVLGVSKNRQEIDSKICQYAANWKLERMAVVDRNILRLSCFELLFRPDIPPKVSINEAVELAKKFSGVEAGKFVNAILDKIKLEKEPGK